MEEIDPILENCFKTELAYCYDKNLVGSYNHPDLAIIGKTGSGKTSAYNKATKSAEKTLTGGGSGTTNLISKRARLFDDGD